MDTIKQMPKNASVYEHLRLLHHDEDFEPHVSPGFVPTVHLVGSTARIVVYRRRVEQGYPIHHPEDTGEHEAPSYNSSRVKIARVHANEIPISCNRKQGLRE